MALVFANEEGGGKRSKKTKTEGLEETLDLSDIDPKNFMIAGLMLLVIMFVIFT